MKMKTLKNWWYYYKWYVICGAILIGILIDILGSAFGIFTKKPDFQVAYVGDIPLPDDAALALEQAFAEFGGDFNRDGTVLVQINQYVSAGGSDAETAAYGYTPQLQLVSDINACDSFFFLTAEPERMQKSYQIFANADGSCPDESDYSVGDKVIPLADCPVLLGSGSEHDDSPAANAENESTKEFLSGLYLGRRCFYSDRKTASYSECCDLWNAIISSGCQNK